MEEGLQNLQAVGVGEEVYGDVLLPQGGAFSTENEHQYGVAAVVGSYHGSLPFGEEPQGGEGKGHFVGDFGDFSDRDGFNPEMQLLDDAGMLEEEGEGGFEEHDEAAVQVCGAAIYYACALG